MAWIVGLLVPTLSDYWLMKLAKRAPMEDQASRQIAQKHNAGQARRCPERINKAEFQAKKIPGS